MKNTSNFSIYHWLKQLPPERQIVPGITYEQLLKQVNNLSVKNKIVVIQNADIAEFLTVLIAAILSAKKIILLPDELTRDASEALLRDVDVDLYINGSGKLSSALRPDIQSCCEQLKKRNDCKIVIATSGTTQSPKLVEHSFASLTNSVSKKKIDGAEIRWGLVYDFNRFAGLQVVFHSMLAGATLLPAYKHTDTSRLIEYLSVNRCTHLSATPTLWRKMLMHPAIGSLQLDKITLGGEIVHPDVLQKLVAKFPEAKITHIYASTEVGVGFSVTDRQAGFPISYLDNTKSGVDIKIDDGTLWVRNVDSVGKYLNDKDSLKISEGYVDTGDKVKIEGNRVFFIGRRSGVINIGGNKIHPEQVEEVLLSFPDVLLARSYPILSSIVGNLVGAEIVVSKETNFDVAKLKTHCRKFLPKFAVPARISLVQNLKNHKSGKIER